MYFTPKYTLCIKRRKTFIWKIYKIKEKQSVLFADEYFFPGNIFSGPISNFKSVSTQPTPPPPTPSPADISKSLTIYPGDRAFSALSNKDLILFNKHRVRLTQIK